MSANRPKDTKYTVLDAAETLILTRGYNAFSYRDIAGIVGIRKASIHHHFATKEDLGAAFVDRYFNRFEQWCGHVEHLAVAQKLAAFLEMFKLASDNAEKICPVGMLTAEYPTLPTKVQESLHRLLSGIGQWLTAVLVQGQAAGCLNPYPEAPIMAKVILNAMSSSLKMARVFNDVDQLDQVYHALMTMIGHKDEPASGDG